MSGLIEGIKTYKSLLKFVQKYYLIFSLGIIGTAFLSFIDAGLTWFLKPVINRGFIDRNISFIKWLPLVVILIFLLRGVAGFVSNYFINRVARNVVMDFRRLIFDKFLKLPAKFYDHNNSGYLLSLIIYNVEQVAQASSDSLLTCLREISLAIGLLAVMFVLSWKMTLLFFIISPLITWVLQWSGVRLRLLSSDSQKSVGEVTHVADEGIHAYRVIRLYGGEVYEKKNSFWQQNEISRVT